MMKIIYILLFLILAKSFEKKRYNVIDWIFVEIPFFVGTFNFEKLIENKVNSVIASVMIELVCRECECTGHFDRLLPRIWNLGWLNLRFVYRKLSIMNDYY